MMKLHFGHGIVLALMLWIAGLARMVYLSYQLPVELTERDYYTKDLRYQSIIEHKQNAAALSAPLLVNYRIDSARVSLVSLVFPEELHSENVHGTVAFFRPDNARLDFTLPFSATAASRLDIAVPALKPGNWKVKLDWQSGGVRYYQEQTLIVPESATSL